MFNSDTVVNTHMGMHAQTLYTQSWKPKKKVKLQLGWSNHTLRPHSFRSHLCGLTFDLTQARPLDPNKRNDSSGRLTHTDKWRKTFIWWRIHQADQRSKTRRVRPPAKTHERTQPDPVSITMPWDVTTNVNITINTATSLRWLRCVPLLCDRYSAVWLYITKKLLVPMALKWIQFKHILFNCLQFNYCYKTLYFILHPSGELLEMAAHLIKIQL